MSLVCRTGRELASANLGRVDRYSASRLKTHVADRAAVCYGFVPGVGVGVGVANALRTLTMSAALADAIFTVV